MFRSYSSAFFLVTQRPNEIHPPSPKALVPRSALKTAAGSTRPGLTAFFGFLLQSPPDFGAWAIVAGAAMRR